MLVCIQWFTCNPLSVGPEKLRLFSAINIQYLLPEDDPARCTTIQELWEQILTFNWYLGHPAATITVDSITKFEDEAQKWVDAFVGVYTAKRVTPYIHAMRCHVGQ